MHMPIHVYVEACIYLYMCMQRPEESLSYCFSGIVHLDLCFGDSVCHSSGTRQISWAGWPVSSRDLLSLLPRMLCHVWLPPHHMGSRNGTQVLMLEEQIVLHHVLLSLCPCSQVVLPWKQELSSGTRASEV